VSTKGHGFARAEMWGSREMGFKLLFKNSLWRIASPAGVMARQVQSGLRGGVRGL
jgi:hypothetical protein